MSEPSTDRRYVLLTYRDADAFLDSVSALAGGNGLYAEGRTDLAVGQKVDVEIVLADEVMVFHTQCEVAEHRALSGADHPPGVLLSFLPTEERTRRIILEYARGVNRQGVRRRPRRFAAALEVDYATDMEFTTAVTNDLSKAGAFLIADEVLNAGTLLALCIRPPGDGLPIRLNAEVAWRQTEGRRGFGVRFLIGDPGVQDSLDALLDRLTNSDDDAP